jgi:hypothetical protein
MQEAGARPAGRWVHARASRGGPFMAQDQKSYRVVTRKTATRLDETFADKDRCNVAVDDDAG